MTERKTYRVTVERDGRFWLIDVPEIERVTQARRLEQAEAMARSLISIMTGEPEDSFDVEIQTKLARELGEIVVRAVAAKGRAAAAQAEASNALRQAAHALVDADMTIRDAAEFLGITHQRVAQLLATTPERPAAAALEATMGDPNTPVDVYTVDKPARRATVRQIVEEVRETGRAR